jgi:subtilisin family serine protease
VAKTNKKRPARGRQQEPIYQLPPFEVNVVMTAAELKDQVDYGLAMHDVPGQWVRSQGEDIGVAVLDTGSQLDHPDLRDNITDARDFTREGTPEDGNGHGTHCCGIIAAGKNNVGVVGVAPKARLFVYKVLDSSGSGADAGIIRALDFAAANDKVQVISMSLGSPFGSAAFRAGIVRATKAGKFVIAAAGNSGPSTQPDYPARWEDCIAVGAHDRHGKVSPFSSQGSRVDVSAPGSDVLSTYLQSRYAKLSGTSMATPFVAGVVALVLAQHKRLGSAVLTPIKTPKDLRVHLERTAKPAGPVGHDPAYGWGLVDPGKMLQDETPVAPVGPLPDKTLIDQVTIGGVTGIIIFRPQVDSAGAALLAVRRRR